MFRQLLLTLLTAAAPLLATAADLKVRVAYPSGMNGQIPVVMERAGIAPKFGFDAEYTMFQNGPPMMEALASGHVDVVITSLMPITSYLSRQPGKAVVVAQLGASSHSLMVPGASTAKSIADLRGKRIAVSFSTDSHLDLLRLLQANKLNPKTDVTLLNTQPNELNLALRQGFADAIVIRVPQVERLQSEFGARTLHSWPFRFAVLMSSAYLKANPDAQTRFNKALAGSVFFTKNNRGLAASWFAEKLRIDPQLVLRSTGTDPLFQASRVEEVDLRVTPAFQKVFEAWTADALANGLITTPVAVAAAVPVAP